MIRTDPLRTAETSAARSCLRVMFVIPGAPVANSMIFARRQAESLAREDVLVEVFYLGSRTSPRGLWRAAREFRARVDASRPQVIHAHFGTVTAVFAALLAGQLPLVITFRGGDLNPAPRQAPVKDKLRSAIGRLLSQLAALRADHIICVSQQLRNRLWWKPLWWKQGTVEILASGVDPACFFPQAQGPVRERLGWRGDELVALFNAAGSWWIKRPALARQAVELARRQYPQLRLEVMYGSTLPEVVPLLMNAADCLLLTSATEGSPTVVQEALACGLPVVTVRVGDAPELLTHTEMGRLAEDSAESLAQALCEVLAEGRRSQRPASLALINVETIAAPHIAGKLRNIYDGLAGSIQQPEQR